MSRYNSSDIAGTMEVALGKKPASMLIKNGKLINVYSGKIEDNISIAIYKNRFAYIGDLSNILIDEDTSIIDANGAYIMPGFIDAHTHLDSIFQLGEYAKYAILSGNTTAITETAMIANSFGYKGVLYFMEDAKNLPMRIFFLVPSLVPPFKGFETSRDFSFEHFKMIANHPNVVGVGETYWHRAVGFDERVSNQFEIAHEYNLTMEGHAAGAHNKKLQAYKAAGISSCHESISVEDAVERLRLGMAVMIREGYIRQDFSSIYPIKDLGMDLRRVMLVSDLFEPAFMIKKGGMNILVREAIEYGFDLVTAVQMVTINPAQYFCLRDLGGIAPGNLADLVIVDDPKEMRCRLVIMDGEVVAEDGKLIKEPPKHKYPDDSYHSVKIRKTKPEDFFINKKDGLYKIRCVDVVNETITHELVVSHKAVNGNLASDIEKDILKMAVIDKGHPDLRMAIGFVHGMGLKRGAIADSLIWDTSNIFVVGVDESDISYAVNRLIELQGGYVVVENGEILAEMPLPVCGITSDKSFEEIAYEIKKVELACAHLGFKPTRPYLVLQTISFTGLPFIRLTDKGLIDTKEGKMLNLIVD